MSICLPDTLNLTFTNVDGCCEQFTSRDIELNRVYRTQMYWNSDMVLPCYGFSTDTWFYQQFHFWCDLVAGVQTFHLAWCVSESATQARRCAPCTTLSPPILQEWDLVSAECDPLSQEYELTGGNWSPCCDPITGPGMGDPIPSCDLEAIVTESANADGIAGSIADGSISEEAI